LPKHSKVKKKRKKGSFALQRFKAIAKEKDESEEKEKKVKLSDSLKNAKERLMQIRDTMNTLKWDYEHGQINPAKKTHYEVLKKEYKELESVIHGQA